MELKLVWLTVLWNVCPELAMLVLSIIKTNTQAWQHSVSRVLVVLTLELRRVPAAPRRLYSSFLHYHWNFHVDKVDKIHGVEKYCKVRPLHKQPFRANNSLVVFTERVSNHQRYYQPSTAKCNKDIYTLFLLAESKYSGCTLGKKILKGLSHDSVNRFFITRIWTKRLVQWNQTTHSIRAAL